MTPKNDILMSILTFFLQKSGHGDILPTPPLPLSFTVYTDHPRAEEVLPGRGPQCGAAPVNIPSDSGHGPRRVRGVAGSQWGPLSLSFLVYKGRRTILDRFPKPQRSMTHYAKTGRGEFTPRKSESKLNGPQYLTYFLDPG
jgi:hypothetical protein